MRERLLTGRTAMVAGSLACFAVAALAFLLAFDVARWQSALPAGDVRYRVAPEAEDLWEPDTLLPAGVGGALIGVQDDVEMRRGLRAILLARLEDPTVSDPELSLRRNESQARLEAIATGDGPDERRSRAAGLLGVLGLARLVTETQDRVTLLESTIASLQFAIALDPSNDDAKFNLELALQRGRGVQLTEGAGGSNPAPGGAGAKGAGTGDPGSGY
jgi:hypothetical protein